MHITNIILWKRGEKNSPHKNVKVDGHYLVSGQILCPSTNPSMHMSRLKFLYLSLPNAVLEQMFSNACAPPHEAKAMPTLISGHHQRLAPTNRGHFSPTTGCNKQYPGKISSITDQDPSGSKSNRLRVGIFWFSFSNLRYVLWNPSKTVRKLVEVLNLNRWILELSWSIYDWRHDLPVHWQATNKLGLQMYVGCGHQWASVGRAQASANWAAQWLGRREATGFGSRAHVEAPARGVHT